MSVAAARTRTGLTRPTKRWIGIGVIVLVLVGIVLGTKVVPSDAEAAQGAVKFDPATFGAEQFPKVQAGVEKKAVDASELATAIAADPAAAEKKYAVQSSGGPVYSVKVTGTVAEGTGGIYEITVPGLPDDLLVRMQTGPAINGTELRDATGEIQFGQFKNQIDFQNAGAALNDEMKKTVLAKIDPAALTGKSVDLVGAFTLINPKAWLITPVSLEAK